ncbi:MAG: acetyl-CoA C-acyltransferase [Spirochaetae bacterium HGW-Spirochaetae-1]|nr:MAG: acetyl-CoA C-acyltransferase [Spirochaetae bacterium HGW-Spirochaetae-1]
MTGTIERVAVIDGCRTPFLRSGTGYRSLMGWEIGRYAVKGLMAKTGVSAREINHVIMGCVATDIRTTNVAREIALGAGLPETIPAHTCTVACISANMAVTNGADLIATGYADAVIAGGVETFSDPDIKVSKKYREFILDMTMFKRPKTLAGKMKLLRRMKFMDFIVPEKPALGEYSTGLIMGENADRLARRLGITRREQDEFAELSHQRAVVAWGKGVFDREVVPVVLPGQSAAITADNGPREETRVENIGKLKGAFDRKYGTVTAANSSFLTDGASAVLLMRESRARELGLKPKAYIRSFAYSGQNVLEELLLGPVFSMVPALKKAGLAFADLGVLEIHEAFSAQMLAVMKCIGSKEFARDKFNLPDRIGEVDQDRLNLYGGSLSIGHPFGATGGRLITTCCNRMIDEGKQFGLVAGCAAGAIGSAIILENAA